MALAEIMPHAGRAKIIQVAGRYQRCIFRARVGQAFQKAFTFIDSFTFITYIHVVSASHVLCATLRHTFTLQRAVSTLKTELRTKVIKV